MLHSTALSFNWSLIGIFFLVCCSSASEISSVVWWELPDTVTCFQPIEFVMCSYGRRNYWVIELEWSWLINAKRWRWLVPGKIRMWLVYDNDHNDQWGDYMSSRDHNYDVRVGVIITVKMTAFSQRSNFHRKLHRRIDRVLFVILLFVYRLVAFRL